MSHEQCLECGANEPGKTLLCPACTTSYTPSAEAHGIGITGPDGKHIAIQDFFDTEKPS